MANLDHYRMRVKYKGLEGLSGIGFKKRKTSLSELFPTADEIVLSMNGYFQKLGRCGSIIYEVPGMRFDVVDDAGLLELAMPNPKGDDVGVIIDVLALDIEQAAMMMDDVVQTCEIVQAKLAEVMGIMQTSEEDYVRRLKDSMRLLAAELRK